MVYEPYNNTREYFPLMGEDCSFLIPFASARRPSLSIALAFVSSLVLSAVVIT
ncbi:hypothetical protein PINS_up016547 [Pythium insidiosum]|nr:hypothetical protein PINS_up016547 [Pythium insidiosum]